MGLGWDRLSPLAGGATVYLVAGELLFPLGLVDDVENKPVVPVVEQANPATILANSRSCDEVLEIMRKSGAYPTHFAYITFVAHDIQHMSSRLRSNSGLKRILHHRRDVNLCYLFKYHMNDRELDCRRQS